MSECIDPTITTMTTIMRMMMMMMMSHPPAATGAAASTAGRWADLCCWVGGTAEVATVTSRVPSGGDSTSPYM